MWYTFNMTLNISPEKMVEYRAGHKKRQEIARKKLDKRFDLAWEIAQGLSKFVMSPRWGGFLYERRNKNISH